jgi:hypothetical protein
VFLEALIISACVQGSGCNESTSAYYKYNKDLQAARHNVEAYGKYLVKDNQWVVYAAAPVYAIAAGQTAHIKIYRAFMLNLNVKDQMMGIQWNY